VDRASSSSDVPATKQRAPKWKEFETLAAAIQRELAPEAKVTPNAKLKGRSGALREIDILIEQRTGQYTLRIVVDRKDYKQPVDLKDVETFLGLVSDIGANKGAIIAAKGFTTAAKTRAAAAELDLFRLVDTAEHKWRSYLSMPAVVRDYFIDNFSFTFKWVGSGALRNQDFRFLPLFRADGTLIDYAVNLVVDLWENDIIPRAVGDHRNIPLTSEKTFLEAPDGSRFAAELLVNALAREHLHFGHIPLIEGRGFKRELDDVTHFARGFTTVPLNLEEIGRSWQSVSSLDQLAVQPVLTLSFKTAIPRYRLVRWKHEEEKGQGVNLGD
jgi:Restriction endonuclease